MEKCFIIAYLALALTGCVKSPNLSSDNYQSVVYIMAVDSITQNPIDIHNVETRWIEDVSPNNNPWRYGPSISPYIGSEVLVLPDGEKYYARPVKCTPSIDQWDSKGLVFCRTKTLVNLYGDGDAKYCDTIEMELENPDANSGFAKKIWVNGNLKWDRDTCSTDHYRTKPILTIYHNR